MKKDPRDLTPSSGRARRLCRALSEKLRAYDEKRLDLSDSERTKIYSVLHLRKEKIKFKRTFKGL